MANRFWVGGTANWDNVAGTKWSTTSGGGGGAAVPTTADDVFFDGASGANVVTVATATALCRNLDFSGFTGTFAGSTACTCAGSWTWSAAGMTRSYTGAVTFTATTAQTITSNGVSWGSALTFNGAAGSWALQDALTSTAAATLTQGTFNMNGNATQFTTASLAAGVLTRTWAFGTGELTLTGTGTVWSGNAGATLTITQSAGSGVVINDGSAATKTFAVNAQTFGDFTFAGSGSGTCSITGGGTYRNMSVTNSGGGQFTHGAAVICTSLSFAVGYTGLYFDNGGMTITGGTGFTIRATQTMTIAGGATLAFTHTSGTAAFTSNGVAIGSTGTIQVNCPGGTLQFADALVFTGALNTSAGTLDSNNQAITVASMASNNSAVRSILLGTSTVTLTATAGTIWNTATVTNLTFSHTGIFKITGGTASNKIWNSGALTFNDLEFGGSGSGGLQFLLAGAAGTNVFRDWFVTNTGAAGFSIAGGAAQINVRTIDFTGFNGSLAASGNVYVLTGDLKFQAGMTDLFLGGITFAGTSGTQTITSAGVSIPGTFTFNGLGGTFTLADNLTMTGPIVLTAGTFNTAGKAVQSSRFNGGGAGVRALDLTNTTWTLIGTSSGGSDTWLLGTQTNLTLTLTGSQLILRNTNGNTKVFQGGPATYPNVRFQNTGAVVFRISNSGGTSTFDLLTLDPGITVEVNSANFTASTSLVAVGTALLQIVLKTPVAGTPGTMSCPANDVKCDYLSVTDIVATGGARWWAGKHSTNGGGGSGWRFSDYSPRAMRKRRAA